MDDGANALDAIEPAIERFTAALSSRAPRPISVGCLPLVSQDLRRDGTWVSELGVAIADRVAENLLRAGYAASILSTADMSLRVAQANLEKGSLSTLASVAGGADRLGVDLVVFGTIERRNMARSISRDQLSIDLTAYDLASGRIAARGKWELGSDDARLTRVWDLAQTESSWRADSVWRTQEASVTLQREIELAANLLAQRISSEIDLASVQGVVYVPPTDTSRFVRSIARLRSAQATFASELGRRTEAAQKSGTAVDGLGPIVLNRTEFPSLQAAEAYLMQLSESLQASDAAHFGQSISAQLAEELRPRLAPHHVRVNDIGFTKWSDRQMFEGELAQGGLARSLSARSALKEAGVALVVAPRIERIAESFVLRVEVYDLAASKLASSTHVSIPARFEADLKVALDAEYGERLDTVDDVEQVTASSWQGVFPLVRSGVVQVKGPQGSGSGFFVRDEGLLITNSHVVAAAGTPLMVLAEDGSSQAAHVVADDATWDIAVLRVDALPAGAHVFEFDEAIQVGTEVAVLGNPKESQGWVLTPGHLSSLKELSPTAGSDARPAYMYTCPTRQGSSGSPVLGLDGRVVAVHCAGRVGQSLAGPESITELTGFALGVPASSAKRILDQSVPR